MNVKTRYQPHFDSTPTDRPLAEIMDEIYTGVYQQEIHEIRSETDRVKQNVLKHQLPMFYPSIVANAVDSVPTGLVQMELDADKNPDVDVEHIRNAVCNLPETIYCFYSPRKGLKFALKTDFKRNQGESTYSLKERYRQAYKVVKAYVLEHVSFTFDDCCENIKQACFVSDDSDVYFDEDCSILYVNSVCENDEQDNFCNLNRQFSESHLTLIMIINQGNTDDSTIVARYSIADHEIERIL